MQGLIFDIQRGCLQDGPGLRTTVFFKGCNLHCQWCHNPESFVAAPQLQYQASLCQSCQSCAAVCQNGVHSFAEGGHHVRFEHCVGCGKCAGICSPHALSLIGTARSVNQLMDEILPDRPYYIVSNGGVTFSGGEPTLQSDFLSELARCCKTEGIHTALETNGFWPKNTSHKFLPWLDLILLDFKLYNGDEHLYYTQHSSNSWSDCLDAIQAAEVPVYLRCPMIPSVNDNASFLAAAARLYQNYPCIQHIELIPYHTIGVSKWESLGLRYPLPTLSAMPLQRKQELEKQLADLCGTWRDESRSLFE